MLHLTPVSWCFLSLWCLCGSCGGSSSMEDPPPRAFPFTSLLPRSGGRCESSWCCGTYTTNQEQLLVAYLFHVLCWIGFECYILTNFQSFSSSSSQYGGQQCEYTKPRKAASQQNHHLLASWRWPKVNHIVGRWPLQKINAGNFWRTVQEKDWGIEDWGIGLWGLELGVKDVSLLASPFIAIRHLPGNWELFQ